MIRKSLLQDLNAVKKITEACAKDMIDQGIFQWNEHYPSKDVLKKDIEEGSLYVIELDTVVSGCIMFSGKRFVVRHYRLAYSRSFQFIHS